MHIIKVATKKKNSVNLPNRGNLTQVVSGDLYHIEEITVKSRTMTDYVYHIERHETWIPIVSEDTVAILDGLPTDLRVGSMVMVPRKTKSKIINYSETDFRMLVVQTGGAINEDVEGCEATEDRVPKNYKRGVEL